MAQRAGWRRPPGRPPRVRPGHHHHHRRGRPVRRPRARAAGLDEPRRLDHPAAGRLPRDRPDRFHAVRRPGRRLERNLYGIQFHPEVVHTPRGRDVLRNFVVDIAGIERTWTPANFIDTTVAGIRERVDAHARKTDSDGLVICALSGGVDSAVAAALVHRAVGDRLTCIYVDHGLMRKKESELLRVTFERDLGMNLVMVDARERFLARLAGVEDPEEKRRIIGDEFIRVFEEEARQARSDRLPDPGHALPGRHRVGDVRDEGRPEDQDPPQRRRAAGRPALPAHRAAALPVQGRGPPGRAAARPARGDGPAPAVPRARPGHPHHRRGDRPSGSTRCARRTGSSSTRSRRPACTAACGSPSRSSRRSARSGSWATAGRTPTWSPSGR